MRKVSAVLVTFVLLVGVGGKDITLDTGRVLKEFNMGPVLKTGGLPDTLGVNYQTTQDINSPEAIIAEIKEFWKEFCAVAEKGNYKRVEIGVSGPPLEGGVRVGWAFTYDRKEPRTWKLTLPQKWRDRDREKKKGK